MSYQRHVLQDVGGGGDKYLFSLRSLLGCACVCVRTRVSVYFFPQTDIQSGHNTALRIQQQMWFHHRGTTVISASTDGVDNGRDVCYCGLLVWFFAEH